MKKIFVIFIFALCGDASSQNLVSNWSFEDTVSWPMPPAIYFANYWFQPCIYYGNIINSCSTDYWNFCVGLVPNNPVGYQYAKSGVAYAGIIGYEYPNYREYIEGYLTQPLIANTLYCVEFYTSLSEDSQQEISNLGVHFSVDSLVSSALFAPLTTVSVDIENPASTILSSKVNWMKISGYYMALGGERFITIGNFRDDAHTNSINVLGTSNDSYYYIDDVSVTDCNSFQGVSEIEKEESISIYPNPSSGKFQVTSSKYKVESVRVMDVMGREIKNYASASSATAMEIDMSGFAKGIYFVQITDENKNVVNRKIVLQ